MEIVMNIKTPEPIYYLARVGLPVVGGLVAGMIFTQKPGPPPRVKAGAVPSARQQEVKLPDDPAIIRLAAWAGRNTEARAKAKALLAAGAKDEEVAEWLALVLISDPAWLDSFILTVPEDRRIALARIAIMKVGELQGDAAWELMRQSEYARLAARSDVEINHRKGVLILDYCLDSPLAADTILNPALGFSDKDVTRILRFIRGEDNQRRILDEWMRGRWKGEPPGYVRDAWTYFKNRDKNTFREIDQTLPAELRSYTEQFAALHAMEEKKNEGLESGGIPGVRELTSLGPGELAEVMETQRFSGTHIPLETFVQLPPKLREIGLKHYFVQSDGFHTEMAWECVEQLDHVGLTSTEKQWLLEGAAQQSWDELGDYETSLEWASLIPDPKGRAKVEEELLTKLAEADPESALEYTAKLPVGPLREKIGRIATEARP